MKSSLRMRAVILAGGRGTRLAPFTTVLPKPLIPVGDLPILEILMRQLRAVGIRRITLSVGYLSSLIRAYFGNGRKRGLAIDYSEEDRPLGTAGPLRLVSGLRETFMVLNGDILTTLDYRAMIQHHRKSKAVATVGIFDKKVKIDLGVVRLNPRQEIVEYIEKPVLRYPVSIGAYIFEPKVRSLIRKNEHLDLPDLIRRLLRLGLPVRTFRCEGHWLDIGRHEDYEQATELFSRNRRLFLPAESR